MLLIQVSTGTQRQQTEHPSGPLEIGRGPRRHLPRLQIEDEFVSRDQLLLEELPDGRVRVENLSNSTAGSLGNGVTLGCRTRQELAPPFHLIVGKTRIDIGVGEAVSNKATLTMPPNLPARSTQDSAAGKPLAALAKERELGRAEGRQHALPALGEGPDPEVLAQWLETVIALQQAVAGSPEFYAQTARAVVELVGLDMSLVLLRHEATWTVAGSCAADDKTSMRYSRTLVDHVVRDRRTFYQDLQKWQVPTTSMEDIEAVVVSPIFGVANDVVGVVYGMRTRRVMSRGGVRALEAQLVQLLAAAVSANLARTTALRTRVQFEQFFSPELVRELERDPALLEDRSQEVTILFSDLRGFTTLSQRLGAESTCRLVRDMMERLSEQIVAHGGVIIDYAGDGILALWNAPGLQADHAERACRAGLAMLGELAGLNAIWHDVVGGALALGIGLNTGPAQVGNTGSSRKFKYGPHGHTVNLASRVQDATKKLGLALLITASTRDHLPASYETRRLGQVRLPGVADPVVLYELPDQPPSAEWLARRDVYETALGLYETSQWGKACQALMPLLDLARSEQRHDPPTLKLMRRAWECLEVCPTQFDPIIEVTSK